MSASKTQAWTDRSVEHRLSVLVCRCLVQIRRQDLADLKGNPETEPEAPMPECKYDPRSTR